MARTLLEDVKPLARLAFYLLEPRSNDSLVTWNVFDDAIEKSQYPVLRALQ